MTSSTLADCNTTTQTRYVLLAIYVLLVLINAFSDVRWSIVRGLSLILLWFCFYNKGDFSLISLHGSYLITKMALMTLGNASIWVTIPGVRFDSWSIVMGNLELAAYLLSWAALVLASWIVRYCARPFQRFPALQQAVIATIIVLVVVVAIDKATSSTGRQRMPSHDLDNEQQASEAEIDYNRVAIYEKGGEISSGKIIRLLRLLPLTEGERVHCEIVNRDLDKASGDYEAVSYTWGEMKEQAIIEIDGRPIRVSRKIFEMLRVLRQTWKPRLLWIDNICINQVDTNEKSHQITLMRHIYYRANSVIIWLDPSPDTAIAIDLLKEISLSRGLTGVQGAHLYGQRDQRHRLLALARLIGNEYFNRLWVVQEIASARKIQVLCGDQSIRWDDLTFVLIFMGNPEMLRSLQRTEDMGVVACDQDSLRHANTILNTKSSVSRGVSSSLAFVLCNFRSLKCKDPRDKVFGILGLVRNTDHPLIHPDYNKTEIQVYKDVAKYVFTVENTSRKLLALPFAGVGHCRRLQELPSWVPDWAANMRRKRGEGDDEDQVDDVLSPSQYTFSYLIQPLSNYGNHTDIMEAGEFDFKPTSLRRGYQAALDTGVEIKLVSEDVLSIRGFVVDEIQSLTSIFDIPFDDTMRISHTIMTLAMLGWFEEAEALAKTVPTPYPTGQPIEEVVWRTMIGDRLLEEDDSHVVRPAPDDYGQVYENYKHAATGLRRACSLLSMEVVSEMRDIYQEMFTQLIGGGSVFKVLVEVLCGRSGHSNVWALISRRTKFAGNDTLRPEFPQESGDNQFWAERLEELGENEETKSLVAVLFALFRLYSPEQPSNVSDASRGDPVHGSRQDGSTEAAETDLSQLASLAPAVSRFPEGLRLSFERRLCTTKNGYIGLVPPLTRVGDIVSIFHGGDAPYLVRPEADPAVGKEIGVLRCRLVGECYMHGMMDGEMIRPEPEPEPERTPLWFHLT